jgi:hypothetical protein
VRRSTTSIEWSEEIDMAEKASDAKWSGMDPATRALEPGRPGWRSHWVERKVSEMQPGRPQWSCTSTHQKGILRSIQLGM